MADAPSSFMKCRCPTAIVAERRNGLARKMNFGEDKGVFIDKIFYPSTARLFMPCKIKVTS